MSFYSRLSVVYDRLFPGSENQVQFLRPLLKGRVLDVGAGTGTLMQKLAPGLDHIDGLESSPDMLEQAHFKLQETPNARMTLGDMRDLKGLFSGPYDSIYCVGNTLVHLDGPEEIRGFLKQTLDLLRPGGTLILQTVNYDRVLKEEVRTLPLLQREKISFQRKYAPLGDRIVFIGTLTQNGQLVGEETTLLYPLTFEELKKWLIQTGYTDLKFHGDFDQRPFEPEGPALIAVARKPWASHINFDQITGQVGR
ncbi:class I SAM-dependent methyltransferase [Deinococcus cellulosilyticus]|nr:class I SAM-dependent methyltransferase [Deinococcus cellulosilyticus]